MDQTQINRIAAQVLAGLSPQVRANLRAALVAEGKPTATAKKVQPAAAKPGKKVTYATIARKIDPKDAVRPAAAKPAAKPTPHGATRDKNGNLVVGIVSFTPAPKKPHPLDAAAEKVRNYYARRW